MGGKLQYGPPDFERLQRGPILDETQQAPPSVIPPGIPETETPKEELYNMASQRISDLSKQLSPFYEKPEFRPISVDLQETKKYNDMPFGFVPGVDNEDFYSDTQGFFGSLGTTALRFPALVTTKLGQNVGFLYGLANPANWGEDIIAKAADNGISNFFSGVEETVKNDWLKTFNSAEDREKGFFSRMFTDKEFWSEDFVDGAAFMGAAWIPGMALNKLNLGSKVLGSVGKVFGKNVAPASSLANIEAMAQGANYFTKAQQALSTLGKFNAVAMATASESLFEANEIKESIYRSLSADENGIPRINPKTGQFYTEDEKRQIAAGGARNGFLMNAALLGITNAFELPYVSRLMGVKPTAGLRTMTGGTLLGEELAMAAPKTKWGRFLNSSYGEFAKGMGKGILREGLVEENVQLAIQRVNEELGKQGVVADMLDFDTYAAVGNQSFSQAVNAAMGTDPIASMNIGMGGLLGGGMTGFGDMRQAKRDKLNTEQVIKYYNQAQDNFLKYGNIFETELVDVKDEAGNITKESKIKFDASGNPIIDNNKIGAVLSAAKQQVTALGMSDDIADESPLLKNILKDQAFGNFVQAHIKANREDGLMQKLDSLKNASQEDLAKFGFLKDDNFDGLVDRYKTLAGKIIKQNKSIESNVRFDQTPEDTARKYKLMDLASEQTIFRQLINDELSFLDELKSEIVNNSNSSLSDGLVDQLNSIRLRIKSQEQLIDAIKKQGGRPEFVALYEQGLRDLQAMEEKLRRDNETSIAQLKQNPDGLFSYENESRNDTSLFNPIIQRLKTNGELENHIVNLGRQYALSADSIKGKENFLKLFTEQEVQDVNKKIEQDNALIPEAAPGTISEDENLVDTLDLESMDEIGTGTPPVELGRPALDAYLKERFSALQEEGKLPSDLSYDDWYNTGKANGWIRFYNSKYGANENIVSKPEEAPTTTEEEETIPPDLLEGETPVDEDVSEELGKEAKSSIKLGRYVINLGDKINDEIVDFISEKVIKLGDDILDHAEVLKRIEAFKGKNITRVGEEPVDVTDKENGSIENVQDTKQTTLSQKLQNAINEASEGVIFGGSAKVINGGSKINNQTDFYEIAITGRTEEGVVNVDRKRTIPNQKYPMIMATPEVNVGTNISLIPDPDLKEFDQPDSMNPEKVVKRKSTEFFKDGKIKEEAIGDFPVRIETVVDGKKVVLGYLPTLDWLEARWNNDPNGNTMNVVEFIDKEDGSRINNLDIQRNNLMELRNSLLEGFNQNSNFKVNAVVDAKSDGLLRTDTTFRKLSKALHPSTKIGIIKNGSVYLNDDEILDRSDVIANFKDFSGKEGWPVVLIPTPTGKTLVSFVAVPTLVTEHQDFILTAWTAFHNVRNAKDVSTVKSDFAIVKAVYDAYDTPFDEGVVPDFNVLRSYINDYITFTSGKKYNPLLKEGTSQLNITEKGEITIWAVKDKDKEADVVIAANPREMVNKNKETAFREKLPMLYYNVKTSTANSNGINSSAPMSFLSSIGGKLKVSTPVTYNQYMMSILETNIEPGRPVNPSKPNSELVHFANPVLTFKKISESAEQETTEEDDPITRLFGPVSNPFDAKPIPPADIQAKEDARQNWITSTESIRKSPTTAGFETTVFDKTGAFSILTAPTKEELEFKISDYYRQIINPGITLRVYRPTAPVSGIEANVGYISVGGFLEKDREKVIKNANDVLGADIEKLRNTLTEFFKKNNLSFEEGLTKYDTPEYKKKAENYVKPRTTSEFITNQYGQLIIPESGTESNIHAYISAYKNKNERLEKFKNPQLVKVISTSSVTGKVTKSEPYTAEVKTDIEVKPMAPPEVVAEQDIKAKKADIEKRRKEKLNTLPKKGEKNVSVELMEFDRSPEMFVGVLVTNTLNELKLFPKLEQQTGKSYKQLIKTREGLNELKKFIITELDKQTDLRADAINAEYDTELARELYKEMKAGKTIVQFTPAEQKILDNPVYESIRAEVFKETETKPEEGLAALAKQAAPETGDLLDLDLDLGDMAEDIGGDISPDLKSIGTSLKTLKKNCN